MKYSMNHYWKFANDRLAFSSGLLQVISMVGITLINYLVITINDNILDIAKDFTALMIIGSFDDIFGKVTGKELAKDVLTDPAYQELFKIETTTSVDAKRQKNEWLPKDEIYELITHFRRQDGKEEIERPRRIRIAFTDRSCKGCRMPMYIIYRFFRVLHVTLWFYFGPFIVLFVMYAFPLYHTYASEKLDREE